MDEVGKELHAAFAGVAQATHAAHASVAPSLAAPDEETAHALYEALERGLQPALEQVARAATDAVVSTYAAALDQAAAQVAAQMAIPEARDASVDIIRQRLEHAQALRETLAAATAGVRAQLSAAVTPLKTHILHALVFPAFATHTRRSDT